MKKIQVTESQLTKLIQKSITKLLSEQENEDFLKNDDETPFDQQEKPFKETPREKQIEKVFGGYDEEIPRCVLRYMRKNPELIIRRLAAVYGLDMIVRILREVRYGKKEFTTEQVLDPEFEDGVDNAEDNMEDDLEDIPKKYPVEEVGFELDDADIEDLMSQQGPFRNGGQP